MIEVILEDDSFDLSTFSQQLTTLLKRLDKVPEDKVKAFVQFELQVFPSALIQRKLLLGMNIHFYTLACSSKNYKNRAFID